MFLSDVSIKRPVFATMLMVALVVLGIVSYQRLAIDEYPDVTYPVVIAQTTYPGASPEVIEAYNQWLPDPELLPAIESVVNAGRSRKSGRRSGGRSGTLRQ